MNQLKPSPLRELTRWDGTLDRKPYVIYGLSLMLVKYLIDESISHFVFHRGWSLLEYVAPAMAVHQIENQGNFFLTILAVSLPFAYIGCALTVRRLRATKLSVWLVLLFFFPVINLVFFKILSWMPSSQEEYLTPLPASESTAPGTFGHAESEKLRAAAKPVADAKIFAPVIPRNNFLSFIAAALYPAPVGLAIGFLTMQVLGTYGWGIFVALPFVLSTMAVFIYTYWRPRTLFQCILISWTHLAVLAASLLLLGSEGGICLIMAMPLVMGIGLVGAFLGYAIQDNKPSRPEKQLPAMFGSLLLLLPGFIYLEAVTTKTLPVYKVSTTVDVAAPPGKVWKHVVAFSRLPEPEADDWLFRSGVAYPRQAKITGCGVGAVRHCIFSTGTFVEPIAVWDEPHRLAFNVTAQALPMHEWTPYNIDLHPRHLDGYLQSKHGEFLLTALPSGGTRLTGTTWYTNDMGPQQYWKVWSDGIIHSIHLRVLNHVRNLSEAES